MKKMLLLLLIAVLLIFTGCSQKVVLQTPYGQTAPNYFVQARVIPLKLKVKYNLTQFFSVKEGDESFETYEPVPFVGTKIHKVEKASDMKATIVIFNQFTNQYKVVKCVEIENNDILYEDVYNGDLSRNSIPIELPLVKGKIVSFRFIIKDKNDIIVYHSFKARYVIEG